MSVTQDLVVVLHSWYPSVPAARLTAQAATKIYDQVLARPLRRGDKRRTLTPMIAELICSMAGPMPNRNGG